MTPQPLPSSRVPPPPKPPLRLFRPEDDFSGDQQAALGAIEEWLVNPTLPFVLGGYAGTGKTTLISYLAHAWKDTAIASLTGKAADVLRSKGVRSAQTIHSLIYAAFPGVDGKIRFRRVPRLDTQAGRPVKHLIIDEASMVDQKLRMDLESFDVPILYVGDHGQLEPIGDRRNDPGIMKSPHFVLTNIHRQAETNPILRLAKAFREGRDVPYWRDPHGRLTIAPKRDADEWISPERTIICGFNKTRHALNARCRELLGYSGRPREGDKLICLANNKTFGIFNGQQLACLAFEAVEGDCFLLDVQTDDGETKTLRCLAEQFGKNKFENFDDQGTAQLDFGYALTAHKSQGSEWDDVLVIEELARTWDARRWRYTAGTRARERLIYCG